jgi:hypothetical protein
VATKGGVAPATACTTAKGAKEIVKYQSDYILESRLNRIRQGEL